MSCARPYVSVYVGQTTCCVPITNEIILYVYCWYPSPPIMKIACGTYQLFQDFDLVFELGT